jgi:apolipoprotein N-acyltransferase
MAALARQLNASLLVGLDTQAFSADGARFFNSAAMVSRAGELVGRYDKMHRVLFGEYVPFADRFPWLQRFTPLPISLSAGDRPASLPMAGLRIAPNICYETVLPHVIRRQICDLAEAGEEPDVLVNLTNDGWFWGSSELDMHLVCGVFRAVECRKPLLIAANTGFSAWIGSDGRVLEQGPRRQTGTILATVAAENRPSWYLEYGDWFAGFCLAGCLVLAGIGLAGRRS